MKRAPWIFLISLLAVLSTTCKQEEASQSAAPAETATTATTATTASVVPIEVEMKIFGLCSLVDAAAAGEQVRTIVVGNARGLHESHTPMIMVAAVEGQEPPSGFTRRCPDGDEKSPKCYDYFELTGVEIDLEQSPGWDASLSPLEALNESGDSTHEQCPRDDASERSLHWLPRLSHVLDKIPDVNKKFVGKGASANDVAARMRIPGGRLESRFDKSFVIYRWRFQDTAGQGKHVQAIADYLRYTFKMNIDSEERIVKFRGRRIDQPGATAMPLFELPVMKDSSKLELSLANIPLDGPFKDPESIQLGHTDSHFVFHYRMLQGKQPQFLPKAIGKCKEPKPVDATVYCGPDRLP